MLSLRHRTFIAAATLAFLAAQPLAKAQIAPARTLDELKAETQSRADRNVYPLTGLKPDDTREALAKINSLSPDDWAAAWSSIAERYEARAKTEETAGKKTEAQGDYRQAWRYYSFAKWPVTNSPGKVKAYEQSLVAFQNFVRLLDPDLETVHVTFEGKEFVGYLRLPKGVRPAPVVVTISALDSRKEESVERSDAYLKRGIAVFALDMVGIGQTPIKIDTGAERMYSRALDYLATRPELDAKRVVIQGNSWSGHWAARLGVVERERLKGVVVQGGPIHEYFQPDWQKKALGTREYLFDLFAARASIYGTNTLDEFLAYGPRLSMKADGTLKKPSAPTLLVNGENDTQVPIADLDIMLHNGSPKEAWVNPAGAHMGRSSEWPDGKIFEQVIVPWVARHIGNAE